MSMIDEFKSEFGDRTKTLNDVQIARVLFDRGGSKDGESFPDFAKRAGVKVNAIDAMGNALADTLSLGTMPMIGAAGKTAVEKLTGDERSFAEAYQDNKRQFNDQNSVARDQNPATSFTSDLLGNTLQLASPLAKGVAALTPGGALSKEAAQGAFIGGAQSAGGSASRGEDGAQGAFNTLMGAGLGAASAPAGAMVKNLGDAAAGTFKTIGNSTERLADSLESLPRWIGEKMGKMASKDWPGPGMSPMEKAVQTDKEFYGNLLASDAVDTKKVVGKIKEFFSDQNWPNYRPYAFARDNDLNSVQSLLARGKAGEAGAEFDKVLSTKRGQMLAQGADPIAVEREMDTYVKSLYKDIVDTKLEGQPNLDAVKSRLERDYPDIARRRVGTSNSPKELLYELERENSGLVAKYFEPVNMNNPQQVQTLMQHYGAQTPQELQQNFLLQSTRGNGQLFAPKETSRDIMRAAPDAGYQELKRDVANDVATSIKSRIGGMYRNWRNSYYRRRDCNRRVRSNWRCTVWNLCSNRRRRSSWLHHN
ncbi:hypothetical protein [Ferrovibrio sp.]|uniref:hypothetical protein n=1 Tax=Ferrovibrio sp. TaxID=1917215 RepID=UPI000CADE7F6|nr:hypothetical protein [Ferrovibrio sp.]PJI40416.1 MAG: hypothetical protein CTR53_10420 [Ferrovibrio sp.]